MIQASKCNETCPEDCSKDKWVYKTKHHGIEKHVKFALNCTSYPRWTETVRKCMEDFDISRHPNIGLLPKGCGKQSTGRHNTVV